MTEEQSLASTPPKHRATAAPPVGTAWPGCPPLESFKRYWLGYVRFAGTASRPEFWWPYLFTALIGLALGFIPPLGVIWGVATLLPTLASGVRRLRDAGASLAVPIVALIAYAAGWLLSTIIGPIATAVGMGLSAAAGAGLDPARIVTSGLSGSGMGAGVGIILAGLALKLIAFIVLAVLLARPSKEADQQ